MTKFRAPLVLALFVVTGCAIDGDLASTEHDLAAETVLLPQSGTDQHREVMSAFDPLVVTLYDASGNPLAGADVSFSAPTEGPSSTFELGNNARTDDEGRAELRPFANQWAGTYTVWASADGAAPMPFTLTNGAAAPAQLLGILGMNQLRTAGRLFEYPLTVEVRDGYGNVVPNTPVHFEPPTHGPTASMMDETSITDDRGGARAFAFAGETPGTYAVLAHVAGAPSIPFVLSNLELPAFDPRATRIVTKPVYQPTELTLAP